MPPEMRDAMPHFHAATRDGARCRAYDAAFSSADIARGIAAMQMLMSALMIRQRRRYSAARHTATTLLLPCCAAACRRQHIAVTL